MTDTWCPECEVTFRGYRCPSCGWIDPPPPPRVLDPEGPEVREAARDAVVKGKLSCDDVIEILALARDLSRYGVSIQDILRQQWDYIDNRD